VKGVGLGVLWVQDAATGVAVAELERVPVVCAIASHSVAGTSSDSVWVLAGNILSEHPAGPGGAQIVRGTRLFRPGSKIYLASIRNCAAIYEDLSTVGLSIRVIGQHRRTRKWIRCWVRFSYTGHWRLQVVYRPRVLECLRSVDWPGFLLGKNEFHCEEERTAMPEEIRRFVAVLPSTTPREAPQYRSWWKTWIDAWKLSRRRPDL
jgi:hypothetical protein